MKGGKKDRTLVVEDKRRQWTREGSSEGEGIEGGMKELKEGVRHLFLAYVCNCRTALHFSEDGFRYFDGVGLRCCDKHF
jgi:hypothetical protein